MLKQESTFSKGRDSLKKISKIGAISLGLGAGVVLAGEKVAANNKPDDLKVSKGINKQENVAPEEKNFNFKDYFNSEEEKDRGLEKVYNSKISRLKIEIDHIKSWIKDNSSKTNLSFRDSILNSSYPEELVDTQRELSEIENGLGGKEYNKIIEEYDEIFDQLLGHIASEDYLNKLMIEFKCSREEAKAIQESRIDNLKIGKYSLAEDVNLFRWEENDTTGITPNSAKVYLKYNDKNKEEVAVHELAGHKATFGNYGLSKKANNLFSEACFSEQDFLSKKLGPNQPYKYLSDPTEIYARKKVLDIEMEKLNIKKYGEPFIKKKHLPLLLKFKKENKLSESAEQFFYIIKPEYFEKVFNEIAENSELPNENDYIEKDKA